MLATCVPWLPGSRRLAPSLVIVIAPKGWVPLALYMPIGPELLDVPLVGLKELPWLKPLVNPMPGMILISSAASRPAIETWLIIWVFSVVLDWPVSTGTIISEADTTVTSVLVPRTF